MHENIWKMKFTMKENDRPRESSYRLAASASNHLRYEIQLSVYCSDLKARKKEGEKMIKIRMGVGEVRETGEKPTQSEKRTKREKRNKVFCKTQRNTQVHECLCTV